MLDLKTIKSLQARITLLETARAELIDINADEAHIEIVNRRIQQLEAFKASIVADA